MTTKIIDKAENRLKNEIILSNSYHFDWLDDDGLTFRCKFCKKILPVRLKSIKVGRCKLCNGG